VLEKDVVDPDRHHGRTPVHEGPLVRTKGIRLRVERIRVVLFKAESGFLPGCAAASRLLSRSGGRNSSEQGEERGENAEAASHHDLHTGDAVP
jgi:hypothetical protein